LCPDAAAFAHSARQPPIPADRRWIGCHPELGLRQTFARRKPRSRAVRSRARIAQPRQRRQRAQQCIRHPVRPVLRPQEPVGRRSSSVIVVASAQARSLAVVKWDCANARPSARRNSCERGESRGADSQPIAISYSLTRWVSLRSTHPTHRKMRAAQWCTVAGARGVIPWG
jgi:hypothetical protein